MKSILDVPRTDWIAARRAAQELDIEQGGYCDARGPSRIHFWAGPQNKPREFPYPFLTGVFAEPRACLGVAVAELIHVELVRVTLEVLNEPAREEAMLSAEAAGQPPSAVREAGRRALAGTAEDLAWLEGEFRRLRDYALGRLIA
jgi:hypothetical protein